MICPQLSRLFSAEALAHGSRMEEPYLRPGCQLSRASLTHIRRGKEAYLSRAYMICDYPPQFICGYEEERRDFNSMKGVVK